MKRKLIGLAALLLALLVLAASTLYTVSEVEQALIVRLGAPVAVIATPGLKLKVPSIDTVIYYDKRQLLLEPPIEQVILGDQKRIEVQTYARYRIVDPLRFYQSLRTLDQANTQLGQLVSSALRRELGQVMLPVLLSKERTTIVQKIEAEVIQKAAPLGIDVTEVRFRKADLPLETSQAIYERMKSERQRDAKELRAQGAQWAQEIQAKADSEKTKIISQAQRQAKITRGQGEATANQILAEAFSRDPQFYRLYRSLQTYRQALADATPTVILSPDTEFMKDFKLGPSVSGKR